jgi:hypothetical protein
MAKICSDRKVEQDNELHLRRNIRYSNRVLKYSILNGSEMKLMPLTISRYWYLHVSRFPEPRDESSAAASPSVT